MRVAVLILLLLWPALGVGLTGLALPKGVSAQWVIEPSAGGRGADVSFAVDSKGTVWFGVNDAAFAPEKNLLFRADRPVEQMLWLGDLQLVRSGGVLGLFEPLKDPPKGLPRVHFKPLIEVPLSVWRMAPAGAGDICIAGYNPRRKVSQVALLGPGVGGRRLKVLYETKARISDAACDGKTAYFTAGGVIWKTLGPGQPARIVHTRKDHAVRRIVLKPGVGLFYVTKDSVGYAGGNLQFDFLRCPRCRLAVSGDSLYVLMGRVSGGVLRIKGIGEFARLKP